MSFIKQTVCVSKIRQVSDEVKRPIIEFSNEDQLEAILAQQRLKDLEERVNRAKKALETFNYTPPKPSFFEWLGFKSA